MVGGGEESKDFIKGFANGTREGEPEDGVYNVVRAAEGGGKGGRGGEGDRETVELGG